MRSRSTTEVHGVAGRMGIVGCGIHICDVSSQQLSDGN